MQRVGTGWNRLYISMANGWIKIHRSMFEDEWYFSEKFTREQAWIDLLLLAEYKQRTIYIRKNEVNLKRGQLAVSIRNLADRWKWGVNKVQDFLKDLEGNERIDTQKSNVCNVITICNYEKYQAYDPADSDETDTQTDTHTNTQTDTQTDTPLRNIKKYKESIIPQFSGENVGDDETEGGILKQILDEVRGLKGRVDAIESTQTKPTKPKKEKKSNPLITPCRKVFEGYYNTIYDASYYWKAKDAVAMASLIAKIVNSRTQRNLSVEEGDITGALEALLKSIKDDWILKNFSVTNIDSKYNEIVAQARLANKNNGTGTINRSVAQQQERQERANDAANIVAKLLAEDEQSGNA